MLTPEENAIRYHLYNQGLIDREIAEKVGVKYSSIAEWRRQRNLPANGGGKSPGERISIPMERALNPDQCEDMRRFLSLLVRYDDIAKKAGRKLDVGKFMVEYRNINQLPETRAI